MIAIEPPIRLLRGHTAHQRSRPFNHRFQYGLTLIDIDIDRLDEADQHCALFSVEKSNLFSFNRNDHGPRTTSPLRPWAEKMFDQATIDLRGGAIRLISFPRHAMYKFAPISLWLGYDPDGRLRGVLYEVHNTFGETHLYIAKTRDEAAHAHAADKSFHVSPFFDITGTYNFTLKADARKLQLVIKTTHADQVTHVATIQTRAWPVSSRNLLWVAVTKPLSSIFVSIAIHWQALKLWLKGAKYFSRPELPEKEMTMATNVRNRLKRESNS